VNDLPDFAVAVSEQFVSAARYRRRRSEIDALERRLARVFSELAVIDLLLDRWDGRRPSSLADLTAQVDAIEAALSNIEADLRTVRPLIGRQCQRRLAQASVLGDTLTASATLAPARAQPRRVSWTS
jgi:hypothetical protein